MNLIVQIIILCLSIINVHGWYGGNVVVTIIEGKNLPQLDVFGAASGETDAFVKLSVGSNSATSGIVSNSLNPVWEGSPGSDGEDLYLGMQDSGSIISLEAWDYDTGLEFGDDLIGSAKLTIQSCWYGSAVWQTVSCTKNPEYHNGRWKNADCVASDSSWEMEDRKVCNATQWVNLNSGDINDEGCTEAGGNDACLLIDLTVIPIAVEVTNKAGGEGKAEDLELVITTADMLLYLDDTDTIDGGYNLYTDFDDNSLYLRGYNADKDIGDRGGNNYYSDFLSLSINLPSIIYICRWASDNDKGMPGWIQEDGYQGVGSTKSSKKWTLISDAIRADGDTSDERYQCYWADFDPTIRDRYGEVISDLVHLGSNLPTNKALSTVRNYLILIQGDTSNKKNNNDVYTPFTLWIFIKLMLIFSPTLFFLGCTWRLLQSTNLRLDRLEDYLLAQPLAGENKTVVAFLFDAPGGNDDEDFEEDEDIDRDDPDYREKTVDEKKKDQAKIEQAINLTFAMNLYYAQKSVSLSAAIGPCLVWTFGICCCGTVKPASIGAGVLFISSALGLWWYAVSLGQTLNWRLTDAIVTPIGGGICCVLVFVLSVVFFEERAYENGDSIDFAALTTVFLTLNMMPNIASAFMNDENYQQQSKQVAAATSLAAGAVTAKRNADGDEDTAKWIANMRKSVKNGVPEEAPAKEPPKSLQRGMSFQDEAKKRKKLKKRKEQEALDAGKKPLDVFICCKYSYNFLYDIYLKIMSWCEKERYKFVFILWFTTGWFGGEFIYLGEYNDAMVRMAGVMAVFAASSLGLSFCVIPVLVAIWINDWKSLPSLLWRYEGKAGSPYSAKLESRNNGGSGGSGKANGTDALAVLLAPCYSINGVMSAFKFSDLGGEGADAIRTVTACYALSVALLVCYCYAAWWRAPGKLQLAFLISLLMLVCDSVHYSLGSKSSSVDWSPGFRISLRTAGRLVVALSGTKYWLVGFACCYSVYSLALVGEILAAFLPNMNNHEAAGIIFFGYDSNKKAGSDMSGRPIVAFGYITFLFLLLLTVVAYAQPSGLPITILETPSFLSGVGEDSVGWPSYVFAASAFLAILSFGFLAATQRASYLRKHGLLGEELAKVYFVLDWFQVEYIYGFSGALSLLCLGGFLFASTGSAFCLTIFVFAPPCIVFLGLANSAWMGTDYQLVVWPPTPAWDKIQGIKWGVIVPPPPGSASGGSNGGGGAPVETIDDLSLDPKNGDADDNDDDDDGSISSESESDGLDSDSDFDEDDDLAYRGEHYHHHHPLKKNKKKGSFVPQWVSKLLNDPSSSSSSSSKIMPINEQSESNTETMVVIGGAPGSTVNDNHYDNRSSGVMKKMDPSFDMPGFDVSKSRKSGGGNQLDGAFEMPPLPLKSSVMDKRKKDAAKQQAGGGGKGQQSRATLSPSTNNTGRPNTSSTPARGATPSTPQTAGKRATGYSTPSTKAVNNYTSPSSGGNGGGYGGGGGGGSGGGGSNNIYQEDTDLNAMFNQGGDEGGGLSLAKVKGVQQKVVGVRSARFGVTGFIKKMKNNLINLFTCGKKGKKDDKKKKKKKKDKKKKNGDNTPMKLGTSHDPAYDQYYSIGPIEAVIDGWLYNHELVTLIYGTLSLLTLVIGGICISVSLTRKAELIDPGEAALLMIPEGEVTAEAAAAVGQGGLDMGWVGNAIWMVSWAAIFLYMAVAKWLSVGGPCTILGCFESVISSSGIIPAKIREKWAKKESKRQQAMAENGMVPEIPQFVHPLVAVGVILSIGMIIAFCATLFFGAPIHTNTNDVLSLWLLDIVILYPILLSAIFELLAWRDANWECIKPQDDDRDGNVSFKEHCKACLDKDGDGKLSIFEVCSNLFSKLIYIIAAFFLLITLFIWGDLLIASSVLILVGAVYIGLALLRDWALNDFYLTAESEKITHKIFQLGMVASFLGGVFTSNPEARIYAASVFFLIMIGTELCIVGVRLSAVRSLDPDAPIYFSPYVVPVYVYSSRGNYVSDETHTVLRLYVALVAGVAWGVFVSIFNPEGPALGVALTSLFLLSGCVTTALAVSYTNTTLIRNASKFADSRMFAEAAGAARKAFKQRNQPLDFSCPEFEEEIRLENEKLGLGGLYAAGGYSTKAEDLRCAAQIAANISQVEKLYTRKYYSGVEALADALCGEGPMGWAALGGFGKFIGGGMNLIMATIQDLKEKGKKKAKGLSKKKVVPGDDLESGEKDEFLNDEMKAGMGGGNEIKMRPDAPDHGKLQSRLQLLPNEDVALTKMFELENRCVTHFQLLISVATEAKLKREQVLLQKFLRNYRFSLISNGIGPPDTIFSTESYSSIDLRLVALWLSSLNADERGRFHVLRERFAKDQNIKDAAIEDANRQIENEANDLEQYKQKRELVMCERFQKDLMYRRNLRLQSWLKSLSGTEAERFLVLRTLWEKGQDIPQPSRSDAALRRRYESEVLLNHEESLQNARETLEEIEKGGAPQGVRKGKFANSRSRQYFDPIFPPTAASVGYINRARETDPTMWKSSIEINLDVCVNFFFSLSLILFSLLLYQKRMFSRSHIFFFLQNIQIYSYIGCGI